MSDEVTPIELTHMAARIYESMPLADIDGWEGPYAEAVDAVERLRFHLDPAAVPW